MRNSTTNPRALLIPRWNLKVRRPFTTTSWCSTGSGGRQMPGAIDKNIKIVVERTAEPQTGEQWRVVSAEEVEQ